MSLYRIGWTSRRDEALSPGAYRKWQEAGLGTRVDVDGCHHSLQYGNVSYKRSGYRRSREVACELITELLRGMSFEEFRCDILGVRFSCG